MSASPGLLPKALIAGWLSFFPITAGMVKGLRSPDPMQRDLMRTYSATGAQVFARLRWPASMAFLFPAMKVAAPLALVGAIVAELPTGAQAGLRRAAADRLLLRADVADLGGAVHGRAARAGGRRHGGSAPRPACVRAARRPAVNGVATTLLLIAAVATGVVLMALFSRSDRLAVRASRRRWFSAC